MRKLLITLFVALALPTAVNTETITFTLTKDQFQDSMTENIWWGRMMTICEADKLGYLTANQKEKLTGQSIFFHEGLHNENSTYKESAQKIMSYMVEGYPGCIPKKIEDAIMSIKEL